MKNIFVFLAFFSTLNVTFAESCCVSIDRSMKFCKHLDFYSCGFHDNLCEWVYPCPYNNEPPPSPSPIEPREGYIGTGLNKAGDDAGGGHIIYLDRHHVNCGDKALSGFKLFRPTELTIRYEYKCGTISIGGIRTARTAGNTDGGGHVTYLDRHRVDCGSNALLGFRLIRPTSSTIAYEYTCGSLPMNNIRSAKTPMNYDGGGNMVFLDRHDIDCGSDALLGFGLYRPQLGQIAYAYTCGSY